MTAIRENENAAHAAGKDVTRRRIEAFVIEHNLDVIKTADWVIDIGPEGGDGGGEIVGVGTPETLSKIKKSYTGHYLKEVLKKLK